MRQKQILKIIINVFLLLSLFYVFSCKTKIYRKENVDRIAEFPYGQDSLNIFLDKNKKWVLDGASGKGYIVVGFVVDEKGNLKDIKIVKSMFFKPFEIEAIRLVKMMPNWIPAQKNNKNVSSRVELPIRFKLEY